MTDREGAMHERELCMRGRAKEARERAKDERGGKHEREVR